MNVLTVFLDTIKTLLIYIGSEYPPTERYIIKNLNIITLS